LERSWSRAHDDRVASAPVLVHLVGPLRVERDGRELGPSEVASRKGRTLLRLLCARRGDVLRTTDIAAVLWPDGPPADPDAVIAPLVSRLRRVLGADAVLGGRDGYRAGVLDTDLDRARRLLEDAATAPPALALTGAGAAALLLGEAPALPEEPDAEWTAELRSELAGLRRRARYLVARSALAGELPTPEDAATAEEAARRAVTDDPFDEEAVRLLLRALLVRGLPAEALRVYEDLRRTLADELGTDPAPATRQLYEAALRGEAAPTPEPSCPPPVAHPPLLAGREPEVALLRDAWTAACARRGGFVVLRGEPGIGKSRLLEELAALARRSGGVVLTGRAFEGERSLFAQPVADALAGVVEVVPAERVRRAASGLAPLGRLVPDLAVFTGGAPTGSSTSAVERSQTFAAVVSLLGALARESPVLLVIDDLQRAGRSTVELLHHLARRLSAGAVLLAGAVRTGEGTDVLELLGDVATPVPLGPLPAEAVTALATRAGQEGRAAEVLRRTGGHPLFVVEVLRALAAGDVGLPASLQTAVVDRVARTGEETGRLLRAAAVLGASFDPVVAAGVAGVEPTTALEAFERSLAAGLLVPGGAQYEFAHDVVREALLATTPSPSRLAWHARAADLLSDDAEAVAGHAEAIGDRSRAGRAWLLAAEGALARFVASDAILLATRALAVAEELGDAELAGRALVARGRAHDAATHFAAALDDYTAARTAARRAGDRRLRMTALRELAGDVPIALGLPPADLEPILRECLALAGDLGDRAGEADVLGRLAVLCCSRLDFTQARALADRALAAGRAAGDDAAVVLGLDAVKTSLAYLGRARELAPVVDELEPLLRRRGDLWRLQWTVFESAVVPLADGDDAGALDRIGEAIEICRRSGYTAYEPFFVAHAGWVHRLAGRLEPALREGRRAVELADRHGHTWWTTTAAALHAGTLLAAGDAAAAGRVLRPAVPVADVPGAEAYLLRCLGPLAEATGDPAVLQRADELLAGIRVSEGHGWLLGADVYLCVARAWRRAGRPERADEILAGLRTAARAAQWSGLID
jgi:DNA-binding SARP family transcriptional activator/tetratricopeptide (TPR) repeat protein